MKSVYCTGYKGYNSNGFDIEAIYNGITLLVLVTDIASDERLAFNASHMVDDADEVAAYVAGVAANPGECWDMLDEDMAELVADQNTLLAQFHLMQEAE